MGDATDMDDDTEEGPKGDATEKKGLEGIQKTPKKSLREDTNDTERPGDAITTLGDTKVTYLAPRIPT